MKKLVFMFVALAAISFASCGNKAEAPATTDTTAVDSSATILLLRTLLQLILLLLLLLLTQLRLLNLQNN